MKCIEIVRLISEEKLVISSKGASPSEVAKPIIKDLKRYKPYLTALHDGFALLAYPRGSKRKVRISCPEVLSSGMCHGCICCEEWVPVLHRGEPTGICFARKEV